jgi:isopentenyldiphosphate isomerase
VMDWRWVRPAEIESVVGLAPWAVSPWMVAQVPELHAAGWG